MSPGADIHADLERFVDGELPPEAAERFRQHLDGCERCRDGLLDLVQLEARAAEVLEARQAAAPQEGAQVIPLSRRRRSITLASVGALAALAATLVLVLSRGPGEDQALWLGGAAARPLEGRLSTPGADRYRPYEVSRGGESQASPPLALLAKLEERGELLAVAEAYLLRGLPDAARPFLDRAGQGPDALATRSVLDLAVGRPEDALRHANRALALRDTHLQARWNRALALRAMGLSLLAAESLDAVVSAKEPGWSEEAKQLAAGLRAEVERRRTGYSTGLDRCRQATVGKAPFPADVATVSTRLARLCFYDALRGAGTADALRALTPAAEALDARFGGDALRRAVADALSRPLQGREELSKEYGAVVMGTRGADDVAALARRARERNQPDIELGAIFFLPPDRQDLERYRAVAQRTQDPWFAALADELAAWRELTGQPIRGLERLLPRHRACAGSDRVEERCLTIERAVLALYLELQQGAEARAAGVRAVERARRDGDFQTELWLLVLLGEVARIQSDLDLAHGYLEEAALRAPQDCGLVQRAHTNLALTHHRVLDFAGARREVERATRCERAPSIQLLAELADLERVDPRPEDAALFERGLAAARQTGQWSESLLLHYEGRFALARDPASGEKLLRRSIQEAERAPAGDPWASRARAYSYTSLILEAGRRGDFASAMALFAQERRQSPPLRCALALAADDDRFVAVAAGPDGQPKGRAEGSPSAPSQRRPFATPDFQEVLRGCPEVQAMSRPPLEGRVKGVPPEIAWSERLGTRSEGELETPSPGPRLLISGALPPAELRLPPLRGEALAGGGPVAQLTGAEATPDRVLEAMADASEIEVRAHGIVDVAVADAAYLALSPDAAGRFALTAAAVKSTRLKGRPLVLLAACRSAETVPYGHEGLGLPGAFIQAGARAVLAVTEPIPDTESEAFFRPLMERIRTGASPATALRDARVAWRAARGPGWVDSVLLFE